MKPLVWKARSSFMALLFLWSFASQAAEVTNAIVLKLTSPQTRQIFQRLDKETGIVLATGTFSDGIQEGDVLEARFTGTPRAQGWRTVAFLRGGQTNFHAEVETTPGGLYTLFMRVQRGRETLAETKVEWIGVGEIFVVAGQSNSANHGDTKQRTRNGRVMVFDGTEWKLAHDPISGASGDGGSFIPPFGYIISEHLKVPIGIIAAGAGGTSVREWLPRGARFPNPPTVTNNVTQISATEWESKGDLFANLTARMKQLGPRSFRAVLWHQGESDANQADASRTLSGELYQKYLTQLIQESRKSIGWNVPWFVAQASYHTPEDTSSADIRAAQTAVWQSGIARQGPDTDMLTGKMRDLDGKGVHFSHEGLNAHAQLWADKVIPWLEQQLAQDATVLTESVVLEGHAPPKLDIPREEFTVAGRPAFVMLPPKARRTTPQPWVLYAPALPGYPDEAERWMHERFLMNGIVVAGVDVGEAYGRPQSHEAFDALYDTLVGQRNFAKRTCLLGRSRGGLWTSSWALKRPERVSGIAGIYPVYDLRSYPGLTNAAPAYGLTPAELESRLAEFNPVNRLGDLAKAKIPVLLVHGDIDKVVPIEQNSNEFVRHYREAGAESLIQLIVLKGQGHNFYRGFFRSRELVDFVAYRARVGVSP